MKKKAFDSELYAKASMNDLILFTMHSLGKKEFKFEPLAERCFLLFPKTFSLQGYSAMIDTRKLDRPLRYLRRRGFIKGDPKTNFSLTSKGRKRSQEVSKAFMQTKLL